MKKLVALGMFGLLGAAKMPAILTLFLFGVGGVFPLYAPTVLITVAGIFSYFVSGFFPTTGGVSNLILGL